MKPAGVLLLVAALALQGTPQDEYKTKLLALNKSTAAKHYAIAEYLSGAQMFLWAREQLYKTIEFDPDHEGARKKLGYKKNDDGQWESDANAKQEFGNKKKAEDADKIRKQYGDRLDSAGKDLSRQWADLGFFCKKNMLAAEMAESFTKALEYDPANASARKELGYEKDAKGVWMSKVERELRREMKDGIAKAPGGQAGTATPEAEAIVGSKLKCRESEHYVIESPHLNDAQMGLVLQNAEHAYAMFHKLFSQEDLFKGQKYYFVILKDKAQHQKWVDATYKTDNEALKKLARDEAVATGGYPRHEVFQETRPDAFLQDDVIHSTAQTLMGLWCGEKHCWVLEGMAMHFTRLMKESAMMHCIDLSGTSPKNKGKNYTDPADWPVVCRVWVREGKDPDLTTILKRTNFGEFDGADAVKSWSLVEFLLAQHREKFITFLQQFKEGKDVEQALKEAWGWTINDLDYRWKQYVKVAY
jgi:hypothetical protein